MKAIQIRGFGGSEALRVEEVPMSEPGYAEAAEAQQQLENEHARGKVVLQVGERG